jgi:hypothetical protein
MCLRSLLCLSLDLAQQVLTVPVISHDLFACRCLVTGVTQAFLLLRPAHTAGASCGKESCQLSAPTILGTPHCTDIRLA